MPRSTISPDKLAYQIGSLARLFASNSGYKAFRLVDDRIEFLGSNNRHSHIDTLSITNGVVIESGWFWDVLSIDLADRPTFRFGGVRKAVSKQLQSQLNAHIEK